MNIGQFVDMMERIAPAVYAEEFDENRIGLVIEGQGEVNKICCALDATSRVVSMASDSGADMLVVHHTPLWGPFTQVKEPLSSLLRSILSAEMNVYVLHTNFDRAEGGINDALASLLFLKNTERMTLGIVGDLSLSSREAGEILGGLRIWGEEKEISRLAVVGGSGFDPLLIEEAVRLGAEAFLSSELKHSVMRASPIPLWESTHYSLEAPGMRMLSERMGWEFIDDPPELLYTP